MDALQVHRKTGCKVAIVRVRFLATIVALWISAAVAVACGSGGDAPPAFAVEVATVLSRSSIEVPQGGRFILVNIPAFELVALEDGQPVLRSRVIVGRPATPTPELLSSMYAVRLNPAWTPTPAMVRHEGARAMPPGPRNPLGQILFELDNDELIFLHDTNDRSLFDRNDRALSHGCVRVERALALAAWALRRSESEVAEMIARGATRAVPLSAPIAVLLAYRTHFPDEDGKVRTYPDIYGRERTAQLGRAQQQQNPAGCRSL